MMTCSIKHLAINNLFWCVSLNYFRILINYRIKGPMQHFDETWSVECKTFDRINYFKRWERVISVIVEHTQISSKNLTLMLKRLQKILRYISEIERYILTIIEQITKDWLGGRTVSCTSIYQTFLKDPRRYKSIIHNW